MEESRKICRRVYNFTVLNLLTHPHKNTSAYLKPFLSKPSESEACTFPLTYMRAKSLNFYDPNFQLLHHLIRALMRQSLTELDPVQALFISWCGKFLVTSRTITPA